MVMGPALGSQIATGPRKCPSQARSRACVSARPRELGTGAVRGMAESNRVRERVWTEPLVYAAAAVAAVAAAAESGGRANTAVGKRALEALVQSRSACALSLTRPVRRVGKMS